MIEKDSFVEQVKNGKKARFCYELRYLIETLKVSSFKLRKLQLQQLCTNLKLRDDGNATVSSQFTYIFG